MCVDLCLGHQFNSFDRHVWFSANGVLFLLDSSAIQLEIGSDYTSIVVQDCLSYLGFFLCVRPWIVLSRSVKNCVGTLVGAALNLGIVFGRMTILSVLATIVYHFATDP